MKSHFHFFALFHLNKLQLNAKQAITTLWPYLTTKRHFSLASDRGDLQINTSRAKQYLLVLTDLYEHNIVGSVCVCFNRFALYLN